MPRVYNSQQMAKARLKPGHEWQDLDGENRRWVQVLVQRPSLEGVPPHPDEDLQFARTEPRAPRLVPQTKGVVSVSQAMAEHEGGRENIG